MKRRWITVGAVAVGVVLTLAACGPKHSNPGGLGNPGGGGGGLGGGTLTVTVNITGDATVSGTATQDAPGAKIINSCADSVAGNDGEYQLPDLQTASSVGGQTVSIEAVVTDYTGPGTYGRDKLEGQGTNAGIYLGGPSGSSYSLHDEDPETSQVVIDSNGGGTWTFTGLLKDPKKSGNPTISGSVSWTCKDA